MMNKALRDCMERQEEPLEATLRREHLVLVWELKEEQRTDFRRKVKDLDIDHRLPALCRLSNTPKFHASSMMAFDEIAERDFGREWLRPLEPVVSTADFGRRYVAPDYEVLSWELVRGLIADLIRAR